MFYTYIYLDPRKKGSFQYREYNFEYEPFYIGKGHGNQHLSHLRAVKRNIKVTNKHKLNKIKKILHEGFEPIIIQYKVNLTEEESFNLERELIQSIGRSDLGSGPLTNLTDGGEGSVNIIRDDIKGELNPAKRLKVRKKISESLKGIPKPYMLGDKNPMRDPSVVEKITGDKNIMRRCPEKAKLAASKNRGQKRPSISGDNSHMRDPEIVRKISLARIGKPIGGKSWKVTKPNGEVIVVKNLKNFCRENNLKIDSMLYSSYPSTSKDYTHKGFKCTKNEIATSHFPL